MNGMNIVISATTWWSNDLEKVCDFEDEVRREAAGHNVQIVPPGGNLREAMADAHVFFPLSGASLSPELIQAARNLKWLHLASAGVEHALFPELVNSQIVVTNSAGVYAVPIAEHTLAMMLALSRGLPTILNQQQHRVWKEFQGDELFEKTVLVVGLGGIGRQVARLCRGVGMRVLGVRRRCENPDPDADQVFPPSSLSRIIRSADWVVLCAALTPATTFILDEDALCTMKSTGRVVNIARGRLLDQDALLRSLKDGRIAGAALDVFEEEPLPADHPFWTMPNVIVSPHTSGSSERSLERSLALFLRNLRRYRDGEPLLNVVDKMEGY